ncbi:MAG TPA: tetratricopeptide repeat protein [Casimicrobiaceae bacterium]
MRIPLRLSLPLLLLAAGAFAADPADHDAAVHALSSGDAQARREAVTQLEQAGVMSDVKPLLESLRDSDEDVRRGAEQAIWHIWSRSGDAGIDALYRKGVEQMSNGEPEDAIATFTRIIELKPEFAEGWNKRATLYFLVGDLHRSLADCDEVMKRNPDHFGALAGYMQIHARLGNYERALQYARRALAVNPNLDAVRESIPLLEQLVEQRRRQTV